MGEKLEVGTNCIISIYAIHHDAAHWPDPEAFDPDRFCEVRLSYLV